MPDPIVPDAQPAASSAAADASPTEPIDPLNSLSETELQTWRTTGQLPTSPPITDDKTADSSTAPVVQDPPASTDATSEPASEPAEPAIPAKTKARMDELLADRARERARAERAEQRARDLEARQSQPQVVRDAKPAASSAAPAGLVKPDPETFPYGTADPGYLEALTDYKVAVANEANKTAWQQEQAATRARTEADRVMRDFEQRAAAARTKHPDFDAVALLAPTQIPQGSAVDLFILEDDAGAECLYHLQQPANAAELTRLLSLGPLQQMKELTRLGDRLTATAPAPRTTSAPPPPPVLSTRATPGDPIERALADGDSDAATGAYLRAANARDLARLKR